MVCAHEVESCNAKHHSIANQQDTKGCCTFIASEFARLVGEFRQFGTLSFAQVQARWDSEQRIKNNGILQHLSEHRHWVDRLYNFFDYQDIGESLIGKVVFYADNFKIVPVSDGQVYSLQIKNGNATDVYFFSSDKKGVLGYNFNYMIKHIKIQVVK